MKKLSIKGKLLKVVASATLLAVCILPTCALAGGREWATESWGLANLICMILTFLMTAVVLMSRANANKIKHMLLSIGPAVASCIVFLTTEDFLGSMVLADRWTLIMLLIASANAVISIMSLRRMPEDDGDERAAG